jgi:thioredoxin 1
MMKVRMTMRLLGIAALALVAAAASEPPAAPGFAPFEQWRKAVVSGDEAALKSLYSQNPPAHILLGKTREVPLDAECQFWTNLKTYGVSDINPKILSFETGNRQAQLVLRVDARAGDKKIVASVAQLWVQQLDGWHLAITQRSDFGLDAPRTLPEPAKPNPSLYPPVNEGHSELEAALARAAKEHKRVLVVFGANWCYDCHVLDSTFRSAAFKPLVDNNYVVVHINIGDEGQDNNDIAAQFGVPLDRGVPNIAVVEANGKTVLARQSDFTATSRIGPADVRAFLERWKPRKAA